MPSSVFQRIVRLGAIVDDAIAFAKLDLGRKPYDYGGCAPCGDSAVGTKPKIYYPSIWLNDRDEAVDIPDTGKAIVEYKVVGRSSNERDGKSKYSADIEIRSLEPVDGKTKTKPTSPSSKTKSPAIAAMPIERLVRKVEDRAKPVRLSALQPGMICFDRSRNGDGQFAPESVGGIDPATMRAAYPGRGMASGFGKAAGGVAAGLGGTAAALLLARRLKARRA